MRSQRFADPRRRVAATEFSEVMQRWSEGLPETMRTIDVLTLQSMGAGEPPEAVYDPPFLTEESRGRHWGSAPFSSPLVPDMEQVGHGGRCGGGGGGVGWGERERLCLRLAVELAERLPGGLA
jgi:hypothetical protein